MSGEPSKKRKREHGGEGSSEDDDEQHLRPEMQWDTVKGSAVLPPPNSPIVEGSCWAQACVMSVEANYRAMYAHHNKSFPTLSIKHCIDGVSKPGQPYAKLGDVCHWLEHEGVATEIEYNAVGLQAKTKYKILGKSPNFIGMDIVFNFRCGILVGGYRPWDTTRVDGFTYPKQVTTSNKDEGSSKDKAEPEHLVMMIGYKRIEDIYYLIYYTGYKSVEFIDLKCIVLACLLFVPKKPLEIDTSD